jgi:peptidyl-prolyl cis-trans isomerase NIMA-interacting 1
MLRGDGVGHERKAARAAGILLFAVAACGSHAEPADASIDGGERPGPWADAQDAAPPAADTWLPAPPTRPTRVGVAHILVAYKGAENAPKIVTRSKDEAKTRAEEALKKLNGGAKFADVVKEYSDDAVTKKVGGALGNIEEWVMPEAFFTAAGALPVDGTSGVVETPRGFHIIHRTK